RKEEAPLARARSVRAALPGRPRSRRLSRAARLRAWTDRAPRGRARPAPRGGGHSARDDRVRAPAGDQRRRVRLLEVHFKSSWWRLIGPALSSLAIEPSRAAIIESATNGGACRTPARRAMPARRKQTIAAAPTPTYTMVSLGFAAQEGCG